MFRHNWLAKIEKKSDSRDSGLQKTRSGEEFRIRHAANPAPDEGFAARSHRFPKKWLPLLPPQRPERISGRGTARNHNRTRMRRTLLLLLAVLPVACRTAADDGTARAARTAAEIRNPASKRVLVIAHRGDWRNYPENSLGAIESVIRMGVDIVELDLKLTRDSVLVLMHDRTIDRTTTGKGRVADLDYDSIARCRLRTAHHAAPTRYRVPTLREALAACKDRIVVNVDQGYEYYDRVLAIAEELGMTDQVLIKGKRSAADVAAEFSGRSRNLMYMPVIDILKPQGRALYDEYRHTGAVPPAFELCWNAPSEQAESCAREIVAGGSRLWVNTLWPSLCGGEESGMYDDCAFENGVEAYGRALDMGATMIQTDRPELLIGYLRSKGLHD